MTFFCFSITKLTLHMGPWSLYLLGATNSCPYVISSFFFQEDQILAQPDEMTFHFSPKVGMGKVLNDVPDRNLKSESLIY